MTQKKIFKYGVLITAVLIIVIVGGVKWVISEVGGGTSIGQDIIIGSNIIVGRDIIDGQTMNKIYDNAQGYLPLSVLPFDL